MERWVQLTYPLSDSLLSDVMCTALEGGISYWCSVTDITRTEDKMDYLSFRVYDCEDDEFLGVVDHHVIATGIRKICMDRDLKIRKDIKSSVEKAVSEDDAGYIDVDVADCIVQLGLLGEITYG